MSAFVYGETGIYPLNIKVKVRMVQFWAELISSTCDKFSCQMYRMLRSLFDKSVYCSPWLHEVKRILISAGLDCVWETQSFSSKDALCRIVKFSLQKHFVCQWKLDLNSSSKAMLYRNFKLDFGRESYILNQPDEIIFSLAKFRCSNHKLQVELGRIFGIPRELRLCKDCNINSVGDEFHFVFECQ